ncbi:MAG: hypothetical protein IH969_07950 [Candidatus Krumholzibacteriota bacterium]|nr:hypothetical protein [Candidatus Krumholzibacteriota bacterium]
MKRLLLLVIGLVVTLMSVNVMAQGVGAITVYWDQAGTNCEFAGDPVGFLQIYYFHEFHDGVSASAWALQHTGTNWTHFGNSPSSPDVLIIGLDPADGISWAYGAACRAGKFYMGNSLYSMSSSAPCASVEVVAHPAPVIGRIEGVDCTPPAAGGPFEFTADGSVLTMNDPGEDCECGIVVPVKSSNWGQIKALYGTTN